MEVPVSHCVAIFGKCRKTSFLPGATKSWKTPECGKSEYTGLNKYPDIKS